MIQLLEHNYGKGRFMLLQIRAAIKAVREAKESEEEAGKKPVLKKVTKKATTPKLGKSK